MCLISGHVGSIMCLIKGQVGGMVCLIKGHVCMFRDTLGVWCV